MMKVYELMSKLAMLPTGANVVLSDRENEPFEIEDVEQYDSAENVYLCFQWASDAETPETGAGS